MNPFLPLTACVLARETCDRIFHYLGIDAECTKVLANLLDKIGGDALEKDDFNGSSATETQMT